MESQKKRYCYVCGQLLGANDNTDICVDCELDLEADGEDSPPCPVCGGTGQDIWDLLPCRHCDGEGVEYWL
jgi:hypothetical protein